MSSPAPELKRARPKPKPRLKPAGIAAPSVTSVPSTLGPKEQSSIVDLTSSSPAHAGSRSSYTTPKRSKVAKGGVSCDDAPSWVVGSHRLDDDVEIVETSTQARLRQRKLSEGSVELDEDQDSTTLDERRRRKEEEEERERLAEEEWMAQARRTVRHVPAASSIAKGKGKAPSLRDSSPIVADGEYDMDDDTDTASATGHEEDEGEFSARNMRRYKRKNQGKHRWMEQTDLAAVALANSSSSSSSDSDRTPRKKRPKADRTGKKPVRQARNSLTPPPPVAEAILQHAENRIHGAMNAEILNPLLRDANRRAASDEDDGIDYFGVAAPVRVPTPPSPAAQRSGAEAPSGPIELSDSDDDEEIQATHISGLAATASASNPSRASSRATASQTRSPSATAGPSKTHRNPLMIGAPDEVRISLVVRSHLDPAKAKQTAIDYFERPMHFKVNRWEPIKSLIQEAEKSKGYQAGSLVVTKDDARVYPSTNPETLGVYSSGELVGYRRDVFETHKRRQEADRKQQVFLEAQAAATAALVTKGAGSNLSSPLASTSTLPRPAGYELGLQNPAAAAGLGTSLAAASRSDDDGDDNGVSGVPSAASTALRLTMRGKGGTEVKLLVKPTQTIGQMLAHYARKLTLDPAQTVRLRAEWDGEELERTLTVGESEMEDGDLLTIVGL